MHFLVPESGLRAKYGNWTPRIMTAVGALGSSVVDVSGLGQADIQTRVSQLPAGDAVCLVGGYDLIPPFRRPNPTLNIASDDDDPMPTDAPYAATPGNTQEEFTPLRPISRIPDGGDADPTDFLKILTFQGQAPSLVTPADSFEEAADEFSGASGYVHGSIPGVGDRPYLSPPEDLASAQPFRITAHGRIHILLHGAKHAPNWAFLFGRSQSDPAGVYPQALSAQVLDLCDLRGCIVTFSSCYAAMLDTAESEAPARTAANQVALACLGRGAKVVVATTRSNWIDQMSPYDGFGPGLVAEFWKQLQAGSTAAEALCAAKRQYVTAAMQVSPTLWRYIFKTALQYQCYGHPAARL